MKKIVSILCAMLILTNVINAVPCKKKKKGAEKTENTPISVTEVADLAKVKPINPLELSSDIRPQDDFFEYVNSKWIAENPIPNDKSSYGAFHILDEESRNAIKTIMEEAKTSNPKMGSNEQKLKDFYIAGLNTDKINQQGLQPIQPLIDELNSVSTTQQLVKVMGEFQTMDIATPLAYYVGQDAKKSDEYIVYLVQYGLGLPDKDYYFRTDSNSVNILKKYEQYIESVFKNTNQSNAKEKAQTVLKIEKLLANAALSRVEQRDPERVYNKFSLEALEKTYPNYNWKTYFNELHINNQKEFVLEQTRHMQVFDSLLTAIPLEEWKDYQYFHLVSGLSSYLNSDLEDAKFNFYNKTLFGQQEKQPRWKTVIDNTNTYLRDIVGQEYVKRYFSENAKTRVTDLIKNLKLALADRIQQLDWMSDTTKTQALNKLNAINVKVGYPDKWKSYNGLNINQDAYVTNILNVRKFENQRGVDKLGKPIDRTEWGMGPQTVNAYYNPLMNEIVFPAAILQPPFFFEYGDDAVNYGGIGMVIGHEITHGFDDQGAQYDAEGNLKNWWTAADQANYDKKTKIFIDQYSGYYPIDSVPINGELTLGENIADLGGMLITYNALHKAIDGKKITTIDGFTPDQRFFINYAQIWRGHYRPEALKQRLYSDVHSPGKYRVNVVLKNLPEFYKAFNVKSGDEMYLPDAEKATMW
ncbi:MAG: M13 family metallopeptidase [Chitinophagales bacterium]|nr:M13 family metallopeptidase [Chitinophagales bacterium]